MARRNRLVKALSLLRNAAPGALPPSLDIGELFIAELQTRRRRVSSWLRILDAMARRSYRSKRRRCRRYSPAAN